ncbi:hypothetical protein ACSLBF_13655 [Pseudoalteromonas sp. T1lg65]|uniref:hypothetical protein n=1 Tax=Pseudoalteromonas sp. T1lg65 TaxID=2077101 RepID=UPI003F790CE6
MEQHNSGVEHHSMREQQAAALMFDLFKHYAWLGAASIGGIVVLLQIKVVTLSLDVYISMALLASSVLLSLLAKEYLVDSLLGNRTPFHESKMIIVLRRLTLFSLSVGVGFFMGSIVLT